MRKSKFALCLTLVAALVISLTATALAEFKAGTKASSGKSEQIYSKIEGGGATIYCGESESAAAPEWKIEKEEKASEKGPSLHLLVKKWGTCSIENEGSTKTVTAGECELEVNQPKEESTVSATVLSTCTYKFETKKETCEIKIAPSGNSKREKVLLADGGAEDQNLGMELALTGVTTTISGGCEAAGIKGTSSGKLTAFVEALQVQPQVPNPLWGFVFPTGSTSHIKGLNNSTKIQLLNRQAVASNGPGNNFTATIEVDNLSNPFFTIANMTVAECRTFMYEAHGAGANDRCAMTVKYVLNSGATWRFTTFRVLSGGGLLEAIAWIGGLNV